MANAPAGSVQETAKGIIVAYGSRLTPLGGDFRMIMSSRPGREGEVGTVTGGSSGYLPLLLGYMGDGMVDGCMIGNVFVSPSTGKMSKLVKACDFGSGVLCLYGDYGGDNMNFRMTCNEAEFEDIGARIVTAVDDVASTPAELAQKCQGTAELVYVYKTARVAAGERRSLDEVADAAKKALGNIQSMGVALSLYIMPEVGEPALSIPDDEIETGMGTHGKGEIEICKMLTAGETAVVILEKIVADMQLEAGDEVSIMINGLGTTPLEEQIVLYQAVHQALDETDVPVSMSHIGEFAASMKMAGLPVTMLKLGEELKQLLRALALTPFYINANK